MPYYPPPFMYPGMPMPMPMPMPMHPSMTGGYPSLMSQPSQYMHPNNMNQHINMQMYPMMQPNMQMNPMMHQHMQYQMQSQMQMHPQINQQINPQMYSHLPPQAQIASQQMLLKPMQATMNTQNQNSYTSKNSYQYQ